MYHLKSKLVSCRQHIVESLFLKKNNSATLHLRWELPITVLFIAFCLSCSFLSLFPLCCLFFADFLWWCFDFFLFLSYIFYTYFLCSFYGACTRHLIVIIVYFRVITTTSIMYQYSSLLLLLTHTCFIYWCHKLHLLYFVCVNSFVVIVIFVLLYFNFYIRIKMIMHHLQIFYICLYIYL